MNSASHCSKSTMWRIFHLKTSTFIRNNLTSLPTTPDEVEVVVISLLPTLDAVAMSACLPACLPEVIWPTPGVPELKQSFLFLQPTLICLAYLQRQMFTTSRHLRHHHVIIPLPVHKMAHLSSTLVLHHAIFKIITFPTNCPNRRCCQTGVKMTRSCCEREMRRIKIPLPALAAGNILIRRRDM